MRESLPRWPATLALPLAVLVAVAALGGILLPSTYARETASWAAQGVGQDWVDLLVVAPFLAISAIRARRGSRVFTLLLGGVLVYLVYSFVLYAFDVHFNSLFLVYCATLGLSVWALAGLVAGAIQTDISAWFDERAPVRLVGIYLIVSAIVFALLWLAEDIPALIAGSPPASLAEVGLPTNPVHVIDLSIVLPAMAVGGIGLLRRRAIRGYLLGAFMTGFAVFMTLAIAGMMIVMKMRGVSQDLTVATAMMVMTVASAVILGLFLRHLRRA